VTAASARYSIAAAIVQSPKFAHCAGLSGVHSDRLATVWLMDAAQWDERYASMELVWGAAANRFVEQEVAGLPPGRAVELACGEGRNAIELAARGWRVTGVDFSAVALGKAAELAGGRGVEVDWQLTDVLTWSAPPVYDLVLLAYLQLPPPSRAAVVSVAAAALAPGGSLLVVAHDARNLVDGTGGPRYPEVLWTPAEVAPLPGFRTVRAETAARPVGEATAWDTVVHLVRRAVGADEG
jgi:SAM-dependent methyltransferase